MNLPSGWLKPKEHAWLSEKAKGCKSVLEIGSYHGRSTSALINADRVWCVDLWGSTSSKGYIIGESDYQAFLRNMTPWIGKLEILRGDSHKMLDMLLCTNERFFDLVFIDGSHEYRIVHGDVHRCLKLVKPGGILCGHDYDKGIWPGVYRAVNELVPNAKTVKGTSLWWIEHFM